ncbi:MAG: translation initiation factor IF-2 [Methanomicrobiales archaeon]|nr:translation initiation factor IF-2 [Methanomicrobiales archaeon]
MTETRPTRIRTPIVCVLGHVDHGKTTLLDRIRGSSVAQQEEGLITQHIGATLVPIESIRKMSGSLGALEINVPGLLFIDTPGHHAFTTLRARGGALSEMAILVVDINEGFQPQTKEALQILRNYRTPFVVAANKCDRIPGWRPGKGEPFAKTFAAQGERVKELLEHRTYELVGTLSELGFSSERYDRITDFRRTVAIVPVSAITGEGIPDLLMVMIGLAQRFMTEELKFSAEGPGRGTVLEVKEERGLGATVDVILYDGTLNVGDEIVVGTNMGAKVTRVRSLLKPRSLHELRVEDRFERVKSVVAAAGVKIAAPGLEDVVAGSPLYVVKNDHDTLIAQVERELSEISVKLSEHGIMIKADTIGALEALSKELDMKGIGVLRAGVGPVSRHDLVEVQTIQNPLESVILCFNTSVLPDAQELLKERGFAQVKVFSSGIIYELIDNYLKWRDERIREMEERRFEQVILPAKIAILPNCVFRQSNPAVVGIRVLAGRLRPNVYLTDRSGRRIGHLKTIQQRGENIPEAIAGMEVAISIEGATVGRQIDTGDELYVEIPERHVKVLEKEMLKSLSSDTVMVLEEFAALRRKVEPFWGR